MEDDAARPDPGGLNPAEGQTGLPEPELPPVPSQSELEAAENLIRQANLAKIRGDMAGFERLVQQASETAPGSSNVHEALGDAYVERKQVRKAKEEYQLAVRINPKNASAERKYGETVLAIQLALDPNFATPPPDDSFASGKGAVILSFLVPGLGQLALADYVKGGILFGLTVLSVGWALLIPDGFNGLLYLFSPHAKVSLNPVIFLPLLVTLVCWVVGVADASSKAKRVPALRVDRPVPPVDKDFEI